MLRLAIIAIALYVMAGASCTPAHSVAVAEVPAVAAGSPPAGGQATVAGPTGAAPSRSALPAPAAGNPSPEGAGEQSVSVSDHPVDASSFWNLAGVPADKAANALLAALSPSQRLAQLFILSYPGDMPSALLAGWIRGRGLGGVKVFGWNADDTAVVARAVAEVQKTARGGPLQIPPFVATDQEGGWIRHIRGQTSITPGNMAIGASAWPSDSYHSALYIGSELAALGVTMNFAPTVDLATQPESTIIGPRAFSADPLDTGILAAAWVRGMSDAGVLATAKHYPGHGDTTLDSHGILPVIDIDEATLWQRELLPYRMLVAEGLPGIMSGHLAFPRISGSGEPASLSYHLIQETLRDRMGFDGLVVTDDLMMTGAASSGGLAETCELAIRAGNDVLMFSRTLELNDAVWTRLESLYRSDPTFKARVDQSARRVLIAKLNWLLPRGRDSVGPAADPHAAMRTEDMRTFFMEQALRSATLLGLPLTPLPAPLPAPDSADKRQRILVARPFGDYVAEAQARLPGAATFRFSYLPAERAVDTELADWKRQLQRADTVVVCVANQAGAQFAAAAAAAGKKLYIVSSLNPTHSLGFADKATIVAVYSYARESFKAAFAVLMGDVEAPGRLPIHVREAD